MAHTNTPEDTTSQASADANPNPDAGVGKANFLTVLRNTGFRNLWLGQTISQIGDYFAFLATFVVVGSFSNDPQTTTLSISGMLIANTLPRLLFGMLAGVFVDRWDRRRTMLVSDVLRAALTLAMIPAFLSKNLWLMYTLGFVMSSVGTFFNPAKTALIPKLVRTDDLTSANALSQTSQMLAMFVGPAIAGGVFKLAGTGNEWVAFVVDSTSFIVSAIAISLISVPKENSKLKTQNSKLRSVGPFRKVGQELMVGLRALTLNRSIAVLALTFAITMLGVGAINVLWITNLKVHFGFTSAELAWRISVGDIAFAAGMVITSVVAGNFFSNVAPKWFIVVGLLGAGLLTLPVGFAPDYWLVVVALLLIGAFIAPMNTGTTTLMQIIVPNDQLGRVGGGIGTITESATLTSMALAGIFGAAIGIPFVFLLSGLLVTGAGIVAWAFLPALTLKDKVEEAQAVAEAEAVLSFAQAEEEDDLLVEAS